MTITPQKKGKLHIDYIKGLAIAYWAKLNWKPGTYPQCLRDAMKEHREYIVKCENERRKIAVGKRRVAIERIPKCKECFTPLEQNDLFHYGMYCRDCFHARMNGEIAETIPIPPRIAKPRP